MFSPESLIGKQIDQFRLDQYVARGAMGIVYKAFDTVLARTVALKLISRQVDEGLSTQELASREEARKRLIQEAKAAGRLSHPNIIVIHAYGETEEFDYICMEYVAGKTLAELLNEKKVLSMEEAFPIFTQILLALDAAAQEQIVHRDIKPSNIMIAEDNRVKVMDFGIAKLPSLSMTTTGTVLGTPYYMSPEQISGKKIDTRSDIFSVGAVLYQLLTGERPFESESTATLVYKIIQTEPIPAKVLNVHVSQSVTNIINKALAKDPGQRYQTPGQMLQALKAALGPGISESAVDADATIIAADQQFDATMQAEKATLETPSTKPGPSPRQSAPSEPPPTPPKTGAADQTAVSEAPPKPAKTQPVEKKADLEAEKVQPGAPASEKAEPAGKAAPTPSSAVRTKTQTTPKTSEINAKVLGLVAVVLVIVTVVCLVLWRQGLWPFGSTPVPTATSTSLPTSVTQQPPTTADQGKVTIESLLAQAKNQMESDPANAQRLLEQAVTLDSNSLEAAMLLGRLFRNRKDYPAAIRQYQRAIRINDQTTDAYFNLGYLHYSQGEYDSAIRNYEYCLALAPSYRDEVLTNLGLCHLKKNNPSQAQIFFKQALDINPYNNVARSYVPTVTAVAKPEVSTNVPAHIAQGVPIVDQTKASVEALLVQAREQWDNDPATAQKLLEQAVALDPNHFEAVMQLGRLLTIRKDFPASIRQYQNALRINKQAAEIYFNLGYIHLTLGNYDSAIQYYESCLNLAPFYRDEVLTNLGITYLKKNDPAQAQSFLKQALDLNPKNDLARNYLKAAEAKIAALAGGATTVSQSTAIRIEGKYSVEGINPDGSKYHGTAVISRKGKDYFMNWDIAKKKHSGRGSFSGNILRMNWSSGSGGGGVVTYTLTPGGVLEGTWASGRGVENLTPSP